MIQMVLHIQRNFHFQWKFSIPHAIYTINYIYMIQIVTIPPWKKIKVMSDPLGCVSKGSKSAGDQSKKAKLNYLLTRLT